MKITDLLIDRLSMVHGRSLMAHGSWHVAKQKGARAAGHWFKVRARFLGREPGAVSVES